MTIDPVTQREAQPATTAGAEDHFDPYVFTGGPADPPEDTGEPPAEVRSPDHDVDSVLLLPEDGS